MLDALIEAVHHHKSHVQKIDATSRPFVYLTRSHWIDRWHRYFLSLLVWYRKEFRLSSVHFYQLPSGNATLDVCSVRNPAHASSVRLRSPPIPYKCEALTGPDMATSSSTMMFSTHLGVRLARLQRQYPTLEFDVTLMA